jgi:hypothetical protein
MRFSKLVSATLILTGAVLPIGLDHSAAQAYFVGFRRDANGNILKAGNPQQNLQWVSLDSRYDNGRTLDTFTWFLDKGVAGNTETLKATAEIIVQGFTSNLLTLFITIKNETQPSVAGYNAGIASFGFGITPDARSVAFSGTRGTVFDSVSLQRRQQQFPGGFKEIDICVIASRNCSGGSQNDLLAAGQSDSFTLNITGNFSTPGGWSEVTLTDFPAKFQTTDGSFELAAVPEPTTILGSLAAVGYMSTLRRKLRKKSFKIKNIAKVDSGV